MGRWQYDVMVLVLIKTNGEYLKGFVVISTHQYNIGLTPVCRPFWGLVVLHQHLVALTGVHVLQSIAQSISSKIKYTFLRSFK